MSIIAIAVLLAYVAGVAQATQYPGDDLDSLCANETIKLGRLSQLDTLARKFNDDYGGDCLPNTQSAINDLKALVDANKNSRKECSMEAVQRYRDFYLMYLDTSDKTLTKEKLPKSLKDFALAYGVQLSGLCRLNMVKQLLVDAQQVIKPEDFAAVDKLIDAKGPIAKAIGHSGNRPDEQILPSDFTAITRNVTSDAKYGKIQIKLVAAPYIKLVQLVCERRFKPIYQDLMLPVAKLANLGFEHRKGLLKHNVKKATKNSKTKDLLGKWTRIVFLCELMQFVVLIEADQDREQSEGNDATQVTIGRKDLFTDKKKGKHVEGVDLLEEAEVDPDQIEPLVFNLNLSVDIPEKILVTRGHRQAVAKISTDLSENSRIMIRFVRKTIKRLMADLVRYRYKKVFGFVAKETIDAIKLAANKKKQQDQVADDKTEEAFQTDVIEYMNHMVDGQFNPDRALTEVKEDKAEKWIALALIALCFLVLYIWWSHTAAIGLPWIG